MSVPVAPQKDAKVFHGPAFADARGPRESVSNAHVHNVNDTAEIKATTRAQPRPVLQARTRARKYGSAETSVAAVRLRRSHEDDDDNDVQCSTNQLLCCNKKKCVSKGYAGDGDDDCGDNSDENGQWSTCHATTTNPRNTDPTCDHSCACLLDHRTTPSARRVAARCGHLSHPAGLARACALAGRNDNSSPTPTRRDLASAS